MNSFLDLERFALIVNRIARGNEIIFLDWGCLIDGYASDLTRTFGIGQMPGKLREVYKIVLDAQLAAHDGPWLLGAAFTAIDPFALMLGRWTRGFARPARSLPHVGPYLQRVLARPATQRAFAAEGLKPPLV